MLPARPAAPTIYHCLPRRFCSMRQNPLASGRCVLLIPISAAAGLISRQIPHSPAESRRRTASVKAIHQRPPCRPASEEHDPAWKAGSNRPFTQKLTSSLPICVRISAYASISSRSSMIPTPSKQPVVVDFSVTIRIFKAIYLSGEKPRPFCHEKRCQSYCLYQNSHDHFLLNGFCGI